MDGDMQYDDVNTKYYTNWSWDYLDNLDTSQHPFPNTLWHVKPAKEIAIKTATMMIVGIGGILLNTVILLILVKNKWLWSTSNYLIGNMAFIDLLTLIFCPWFMLIRDFYQNYVLKNFGCRFEGFLQASLLIASVCAVMLVSYDRLAAAALPSDARVTKKAAPKLIVASWLVAASLSLPWVINRDYVERQWLDYVETFCVEDPRILGVYWHFMITLVVWIPLALMLLTYAGVMWRLECGGGQAASRAKGGAVAVAAAVLLAAALCRVPYTALIYRRNNNTLEINAVEGSYNVMWFAANYLMYLNCALNPLIYGFTNARYRKAMDRTVGVARCKFGSWCCSCSMFKRNQIKADKNAEKIFVIGNTPRANKKLSRVIKNILHINKESVELSVNNDQLTTKPGKVTSLETERV